MTIQDGCVKESSDKSITLFLFEASKNPGLSHDAVAEITDDRITAIVPAGVNIKALVASFSYSGDHVSVNNTIQTEGVSVNDFSYRVEYAVTAKDGSVRRYQVTVKVSDNIISSFVFKKSLNSALSGGDISAVIRNDSIIAELPANVSLTSLIASYTNSLSSTVTVNGLKQNSGISRNDFSSTVEYVVEGIDGSKRIYKAVIKQSYNLTKFWIKKSLNPALNQDIEFVIDYDALSIEGVYLRWIDSENPSRLVVSFDAPGVSVTYGGSALHDGVTAVDFKHPVQIVTTSENNISRTYSVELICPQINATLPILRIEADGAISGKEDYVKAKLEIVGNGINEGLWNFNREKIEIRLRGNSTMWLPKKPYRIKFPEKYSPLGLTHAREKSWVLLANDADKSLIRNAVAFKISEIMQKGADYRRFTACTRFVDVYLNGSYEGNYHLTDQIEVSPGRVDVKSLKASDAGNANSISGGYLIEFDGFADGEPLWFTSPKNMKITIKYPKDDDYAPEQKAWLINFFTTTENALFSQDFKNPNTGWRKYINMTAWIDYCIINELAGNSDAWWQTFMSKERNEDFFVAGPVWDFDIAFNNDNRIYNATNRLMIEAAHDPKTWINRFMQDETFKSGMKTRWNEKKEELLGVIAYMDELALLLDMSQKANFKRWDINRQSLGHANPAPASYQKAIEQMKNYMQTRYNFLNTEFNKW
jgi:hypothetical protein